MHSKMVGEVVVAHVKERMLLGTNDKGQCVVWAESASYVRMKEGATAEGRHRRRQRVCRVL